MRIVVFNPQPGTYVCSRIVSVYGQEPHLPTPNIIFQQEGSDVEQLEEAARQACLERGITKVINLDLAEKKT